MVDDLDGREEGEACAEAHQPARAGHEEDHGEGLVALELRDVGILDEDLDERDVLARVVLELGDERRARLQIGSGKK